MWYRMHYLTSVSRLATQGRTVNPPPSSARNAIPYAPVAQGQPQINVNPAWSDQGPIFKALLALALALQAPTLTARWLNACPAQDA